MARRYANEPTVVFFGLYNEPVTPHNVGFRSCCGWSCHSRFGRRHSLVARGVPKTAIFNRYDGIRSAEVALCVYLERTNAAAHY